MSRNITTEAKKNILVFIKFKKANNKYSCSGPPAFKSGSCRPRFS